jgi:hypothetical protein
LCGHCYYLDRRSANLEREREQQRIRAQRQRDTRRDVLNERKRADYEADPDKFKRRVAAFRVENLEKVRAHEDAKYQRMRAENPEQLRKWSRKASKRYRSNPDWSLKNRE